MSRVKGRVDEHGRECSKCGGYQPWTEYWKTTQEKKGVGGRSSACRKCCQIILQARRLKENPGRKPHRNWRIDTGGRECTGCGQYKAWEKYGRIKDSAQGYSALCSICGRQRKYIRSYGINYAEFQRLLDLQKGVCAICGEGETVRNRGGDIRPLSIDHDHVTGKIRGLLCANCNVALGLLGDSITRLSKALAYLSGTVK